MRYIIPPIMVFILFIAGFIAYVYIKEPPLTSRQIAEQSIWCFLACKQQRDLKITNGRMTECGTTDDMLSCEEWLEMDRVVVTLESEQ